MQQQHHQDEQKDQQHQQPPQQQQHNIPGQQQQKQQPVQQPVQLQLMRLHIQALEKKVSMLSQRVVDLEVISICSDHIFL